MPKSRTADACDDGLEQHGASFSFGVFGPYGDTPSRFMQHAPCVLCGERVFVGEQIMHTPPFGSTVRMQPECEVCNRRCRRSTTRRGGPHAHDSQYHGFTEDDWTEL